MIRHGSMFSGIEGFGLGLAMVEPTETVWQAELNPFCNEILELRYPDAANVGDVRLIDAGAPAIEVLTAGFPCQPVSQAGKGLAQEDDRWLWPQVARVIGLLRPRVVLIENVRGLRGRGLADVLRDLAALGYDAQWDLLPAAAFGAPHLRHRFFIVAYPSEQPIGRIYRGVPPVFQWADEEPFKPRLLPKVHRRRERLTALGNAVVPQHVAGVWWMVRTAGTDYVPETLMGDTIGEEPPVAGALIGGLVHQHVTVDPKPKTRLWPTPAANESEWSVDALACVDAEGRPARNPHERFYHPGTHQIVQRTLTNYVRGNDAGLWPEPPDLWPTATAKDGIGSRNLTSSRPEGSEHHSGVTLTDAAVIAETGVVEVVKSMGGRGLNPEWVGWLMGYPPRWTDDRPAFVPRTLEQLAEAAA